MYEVEFRLNGSVVAEYSEIFDVSVSPHRSHGTAFFLGQPRRATFSLLNDGWLYPTLFQEQKNENYGISNYVVQLQYSTFGSVITGFIKLDMLNYNEKTGVVTISIYDYSYAYSFYTDSKTTVSTFNEKQNPSLFFQSYVQKIIDNVGLTVNNEPRQTFAAYNVVDEKLFTIPNDIFLKFIEDNYPNDGAAPTYNYHHFGFCAVSAASEVQPSILISMQRKYVIIIDGTVTYTYVNLFKVWQCFNYACWEERKDLEYARTFEGSTDPELQNAAQTEAYNNYTNKLYDYGWTGTDSYTNISTYGNTTWTLYDKTYDVLPTIFIGCSIKITGNILAPEFTPDQIETNSGEYEFDDYKAFKAMLIYYSYYSYNLNSGTFILANKLGNVVNAVTIPRSGVTIDFNVSNLGLSRSLDLSELDYLKGDCTELKRILRTKILDEFINLVSIKITISDISTYNIELNGFIFSEIDENYYKIVELNEDFKEDEYTAIGWRV